MIELPHLDFRACGECWRCDPLLAALAWTLRTQDVLPLPSRRYVVKADPENYWSPYR
ncbi:MAG: hypothetical protein GXP25_05625 [Planctomycetes bacterium]|nr:hypothetical protein [Planctomycetota bacterium]